MNGYIKRSGWITVTLFGCLLLASSAQAASFDCGKATTNVEKLVCDTPAISKLDDELGKLYQDVLGKANEEQKQLLITEQKHWLKHTRNVCTDEICLKLAYWSRQAGLEMFFEPKSPLYKHEADKAEAIKQVLATAPLYYSEGIDKAINQSCRQMFDDLKQMNGIRFVDPVVQTQSYEDPALDEVKQHCGAKPPLHFNRSCVAREVGGLPLTGKDGFKNVLALCDVGFGLPPFKLYELTPIEQTGESRFIFYADEGYGPMNLDWKKPLLGGGFSGFSQIDPKECKLVIENGTGMAAGGGDRDGKNYNSIMVYKNQYYFFVLHKPPLTNKYWLAIQPVEPSKLVCNWFPVALKSPTSNPGSK